ncbi:MAG TPA: hypothetical protein VKM55_10625 [Candidatus Lokiarchaeia archaeon]|nr:hypothetical protein [Candidatus Lokiarchaeia archaeon]
MVKSVDDGYDVIVVGAGTGGAIAARFARQSGLNTRAHSKACDHDMSKINR